MTGACSFSLSEVPSTCLTYICSQQLFRNLIFLPFFHHKPHYSAFGSSQRTSRHQSPYSTIVNKQTDLSPSLNHLYIIKNTLIMSDNKALSARETELAILAWRALEDPNPKVCRASSKHLPSSMARPSAVVFRILLLLYCFFSPIFRLQSTLAPGILPRLRLPSPPQLSFIISCRPLFPQIQGLGSRQYL